MLSHSLHHSDSQYFQIINVYNFHMSKAFSFAIDFRCLVTQLLRVGLPIYLCGSIQLNDSSPRSEVNRISASCAPVVERMCIWYTAFFS